ncbi:MAG: hypothetical protein Kow00121_39080 [Elainellaceae cyanobacterium]
MAVAFCQIGADDRRSGELPFHEGLSPASDEFSVEVEPNAEWGDELVMKLPLQPDF